MAPPQICVWLPPHSFVQEVFSPRSRIFSMVLPDDCTSGESDVHLQYVLSCGVTEEGSEAKIEDIVRERMCVCKLERA